MNAGSYKIFPLGNDALTIEFGNDISVELNETAVNLANYLDANRFAGLIETVPAYASLTVFYDVFTVRKNFPDSSNAFEKVKKLVENALQFAANAKENSVRLIEIPVDFSPEFALDLDFAAKRNGLSTEEVIEIFTAKIYRVFMLGFLPGFAYMGELDARIAAPRKVSPRLNVPRGSVGIAGRQTGVYPFDSPGGWQIIGRTETEFFTPQDEDPCLLRAGDSVKFYDLNK